MYTGYRYPSQIISHAVWLYHLFTLSFRDIEELLAARGINVSYESIREWCLKFGNQYCKQIKKNRGQLGDTLFSYSELYNVIHCWIDGMRSNINPNNSELKHPILHKRFAQMNQI
jgi:hypothetical protein